MRALWAMVLLAGCGKAYVNPISIEARAEPPAVMLLFDKSGSMAAPLMPSTCPCGFPTCNESTCPTRIGTVRQWTHEMLPDLGDDARWGLTIFPADNACTPAGASQVLTPIPETVGAGDVDARIQSLNVGGGTPTAGSLTFAGQTFESGDAERIVLLVTDGQPNCSPQNPNTCTTPALCRCTLSGGACGTVVNDGDPTNFCRRGCLDEDGAVSAIRSLTTFGIFTLVVGFGSDLTDPTVLDAMAQAGLDGQRCVTDTDCFGFTCGASGTCTGTALFASDLRGLTAVTETLRKKLTLSGRCRWTLSVDLPAGPTEIYFGAVKVPASDWKAETTGRVRFYGDSCKTLLDDPAVEPVFYGQP